MIKVGATAKLDLGAAGLEADDRGRMQVDPKTFQTKVPHIYAAGDVTTVPYKQIVIAMGEGAKAALAAFEDRIRAA